MSMSVMSVIGNLIFSEGYDLVIDQTHTGYVYFGLAKREGTTPVLTSEAKWAIIKLTITNTNKLNWFRWPTGNSMQFNQVWNANGLDDVYSGAL